MTHLRQLILDELERRNYSPNTARSYLHAVEKFARHLGRSPEQLGADHVREYQVHLFRDRKLSARTIAGQTAALRFLFVKTLRRPYLPDALPSPGSVGPANLIDPNAVLFMGTRRDSETERKQRKQFIHHVDQAADECA
ncbi:Mobile element protein [Acidisarcina polymorpha]|uniref:Mobile element protein n=1 Tax=Acidisarcina polymorpha TaxID=2211140 RepID=A0A2Z5G126_9BACT|nr:site-specific integrase [Acidisarcina polymorpha]AXC12710.1 Mobile element protein [Acidisarcina polymorpha]